MELVHRCAGLVRSVQKIAPCIAVRVKFLTVEASAEKSDYLRNMSHLFIAKASNITT